MLAIVRYGLAPKNTSMMANSAGPVGVSIVVVVSSASAAVVVGEVVVVVVGGEAVVVVSGSAVVDVAVATVVVVVVTTPSSPTLQAAARRARTVRRPMMRAMTQLSLPAPPMKRMEADPMCATIRYPVDRGAT